MGGGVDRREDFGGYIKSFQNRCLDFETQYERCGFGQELVPGCIKGYMVVARVVVQQMEAPVDDLAQDRPADS